MGFSVDSEWFATIYQNALDQLGEIDRISRISVNIGNLLSSTMKGYLLEDRHLHDTLVAVLNAMASDWKATKTCVSNFTHFDNYASRLCYHESTEHMEYGCDALWGNDNVNAATYSSGLHVNLGNPTGGWISSQCINNLDLLCNKYEDLAAAIGDYMATVSELSSKSDFYGNAITRIKDYMSRVHTPVARSLRVLLYTINDIIRAYKDLYNRTMAHEAIGGEYLIDTDSIQPLKNQIANNYQNLRSRISDFNYYVCSVNSNYRNIHLNQINNYCIDNAELQVKAEISRVENLIESNEEIGREGVAEIRGHIDSFANVVADLGMSTGYRMIYPDRQFESIISLPGMRTPELSNTLFDRLLSVDCSKIDEAALKNDIIFHLIRTFSNRRDYAVEKDRTYYSYNAYRGYDEDVLMGKIKDLNLRDMEFVRRWRDLYNSMLNDGYTELNAIRFSEIAALYNSEGIRTCSNFVGEHDSIVITGIQNYVVDYIKYIANSPDHGYDQLERWAGNNDFDCATLIISGYDKAFIDLRHTITHMRFDDNPVAYSAVGAAALANNDLSAYGFVSHFPNQDFGTEDLVPGDVFAVDVPKGHIAERLVSRGDYRAPEYWDSYNDEDDKISPEDAARGEDRRRFISHVEVYTGKYKIGDHEEHLNVSAHSSENIDSEGSAFGEGGDQLQQDFSLITRQTDSPYSGFYYRFICQAEEGGSFYVNPKDGTPGKDCLENDRVSEIRHENIGARSNWGQSDDYILGDVFWPHMDDKYPAEVMWDRIHRLESMDYWKTYEVHYADSRF